MDSAPTDGFSAAPDQAAGFTYINADQRTGTAPNGKPNLSIDEAALRLTRANSAWGGGGGNPTTVTYGFRSDAPSNMPDDAGGFTRFNPAQIVQAELALAGWSDVANIRFIRVGVGSDGDAAYTNSATILFSSYTTGVAGATAFGYFPGSRSDSSRAGDVWTNISQGYNASPVVGGYGGQVLAHEIGHAIGLEHPSDYDAAPNTNFTYAADASYFEDSRQYSIMSYFGGFNTGANLPGYAASPLIDDIAAAQRYYGPNMTTRTGDTVYGFNANADRPWFIAVTQADELQFAVWDAGGNDTFDFSGYGDNQLIDLRQGFFSDVGGQAGNVSIAKGTDIENALGGRGSDSITGNALANRLEGGSGNDTVLGGAGNDTVTDTSGSNYLRGEDGNDALQGGSGFDDINGNSGNDTASGGAGDDWVVGGKDNDLLDGDAGNDIVYGNLGDDTASGGLGNDLVRGGQGNDSLTGNEGDDWLSGDRGDDTLSGGAGADIFHSFGDAGLDRVLDFNAAEGDRVLLDPGTGFQLSQVGADTVVTMTGGGQLVLVGVQLALLPAGWLFIA